MLVVSLRLFMGIIQFFKSGFVHAASVTLERSCFRPMKRKMDCTNFTLTLHMIHQISTENLVFETSIDLTDYSFFTQWPRFRVKHLLEFVRSKTELQPCY